MQKKLHTEITLDQPVSRARRMVAWLTLVAYIGYPMAATAQVIADQTAAGQNRPVIDSTANGIPLVQIAAPNAAGVSHNLYTQYNVDHSGLILNNSNAAVLTQQAGYVSANPNMANGTAHVILNEVTGTSQSQLNGYTEVAGSKAEVIIANPNGITCNGCGFINTSRGVLTTGTPVFGGSGSLDAFRVTGGQIFIDTSGLNGTNLDQLDLIARSVKVNGELWATNLNVITGANQVNYANLGVQVIAGDSNKPTIGIDVAQLGGMYANKILLVGTEAGVGVNSLGTMSAYAGDFTLNNKGLITLVGNTTANGNITINGAAGTTNSGTLYSQQNVLITDLGNIVNSGTLTAQGNLTLNGLNINSSGALGAGIDIAGKATKVGNMSLTATNRIDATGQNMAGTDQIFSSDYINLANSNTIAGGNLSFTAKAGDIVFNGGFINSVGTLDAVATGLISNDSGLILGNSLNFHSANFSNQSGQIGVGTVAITTGNADNSGGAIIANQLSLTANNLTNKVGYLENTGTGATSLLISNVLDNTGGWIQTSSTDFTLTPVTLINDYGKIAHTGLGFFTVNAGSVSNIGGSISTYGQSSITANTINNEGGVLLAGTQSTLNGILDNSVGGYIGAASLTIVSNTGAVNNSTGSIEAINGISLTAQSLNNAGGSIKNLGSTTTDSNVPTLLNIVTTQGIVNSALNGTMGSIGSNGQLTISAASLDNSGGEIYGKNLLGIQTGAGLTNQNGWLQTDGELNLIIAAALNNQGGAIEANGTTGAFAFNLQAASIDNTSGRIANMGTSLTSINGGTLINNSAGTIGGEGDVSINAVTLLNNQISTQKGMIISSNNLTLDITNSLDNSEGQIYASGKLDFKQAAAALNNTAGIINIGSGSSNPTSNTSTLVLASINNDLGGMIVTSDNLDITTASLTGLGKILGGGNVSIQGLQGDYTYLTGNTIGANGNLTLGVSGTFTNQGDLEAMKTLTVNAGGNIVNNAGATLNSGNTVLNATTGDITNYGYIYGTQINTTSNNFTNYFSIIGNDVYLTANNFYNTGAQAFLGAPLSVNLWVKQELQNTGGAQILSNGEINIAADSTMDGNGNYTHLTQHVLNESSLIEADGSINIGAVQIDNQRPTIAVQNVVQPITTQTLTPPFNYATGRLMEAGNPPMQGVFFAQDITGLTATSFNAIGNDPISGKPVVYYEQMTSSVGSKFSGSTLVYNNITTGYDVVPVTQLIPQSQILSVVNGPTNDPATGLAANITVHLTDGTTQYFNTLDKQGTYYTVSYYPGYDPAINVHPSKLLVTYTTTGPDLEKSRVITTTVTDQVIAPTTPVLPEGQILASQNMNLNVGSALNNYISTIAAGGNVTISGVPTAAGSVTANPLVTTSVNNTALTLQETTATSGTVTLIGTYSCGFMHGSTCTSTDYASLAVTHATPITLSTSLPSSITAGHTLTISAGTVSNQSATGNNTQISGATLGGTQSSATVVGSGAPPSAQNPNGNSNITPPSNVGHPNIKLPTSGLYTINTKLGQQYLIVTDPHFTNYQNFLSSDYMLNRLSLDPALMQKRLGDGFYEEQLVTDQITQLTGHRFLGQYASAEDQYKALMDSGVATAQAFKLVPGVELTKEQIAALTSDIVWLVNEKVTLPNGTVTTVLVPQLYLCRLHAGDLQPGGAMIAADVINISTSGTVANSGTISGASAAMLQAQNVFNKGGTISSSGTVLVSASNDILNQSGTISGNNVSLGAGHDIVNSTLTQNIKVGNGSLNASNTLIGNTGTISAIGNLNLNAGHDLTISGALVKAGGDATIYAGNNLTVNTIVAESTGQSSAGSHYTASQTTNLASNIDVGGKLNLTGMGDVTLTSAQISTGNNLTVLSGGNLTIDASKNNTSVSQTSGLGGNNFYASQSHNETVVGSNITSGAGIILGAIQLGNTDSTTPRTDGKGNITVAASNLNATGAVQVIADNNVDIQTVTENHSQESASSTQSHGTTTTTTTTTHDYVAHTNEIGSSINGGSVVLQAGNNLGITGGKVVGQDDVTLAAGNNVEISAATNTQTEDHHRNQHTSGLQASNGFNITDQGPNITNLAHLDATTQSTALSSIQSGKGNINVIAGSNIIITGSDLVAAAADNAANAGDSAAGKINLAAGGTVEVLAGQDTLNQSSSTQIVTNPNAFTKQRHTITDTSASLDYFGSNLSGNSVNMQSGGDIVLQATHVNAGTGGININAAGDVQLLAAANQSSHTHTETLATDGYTFRADGSLNDTDTRRQNNKAENQTVTNQVTSFVSSGNITSHSGGDTLIQASNLDAQGSIAFSATGYATTYNEDGSVKQQGKAGTVTFASVNNSTYTNVVDSQNSMPWQSSSGHGGYVETTQLANIHAGNGLTVDAKGGVVVDIPVVPATPAPAQQVDAQGNVVPPVPLTAAQQAAQQQADLDKHIQNIASKPGQEWIGQLAQMAKDKPDSVKLQQVNAAVQHWDYQHEGLTQEAAAVIVIVVTYFTAGAVSSALAPEAGGAGAAAAGGTAAATTTAATATTASTWAVGGLANTVVTAGVSTLAGQASVALINNHGNIGQTLEDLGKSENVKATIAAMLTAGVMQSMGGTEFMQGIKDGATAPLSTSSLISKLELNLTNATVNTAVNSVVYGTSFTNTLGTNLQNAGIDTLAAAAANVIGQSYKGPDGYLNGQPILHDLAHAALGCAAAAAKKQDCGSGALGGFVGEASAELIGGSVDGSQYSPQKQGQIVFLTQLATAGAAITTGSNLNTALAASNNAVVNNFLHNTAPALHKSEQQQYADAVAACSPSSPTSDACKVKSQLELTSLSRDNQIAALCNGIVTEACTAGIHTALENGSHLAWTADGKLYVVSPEAPPSLTTPPGPTQTSMNSTHNQLASNLSSGLLITGAVAATEAGVGVLYDMGVAAQTTVLTDGLSGVSTGELVKAGVTGGLVSGGTHLATDPNASPSSVAVNTFAGVVGGTSTLTFNAAAGLANQWVPTTVGNLITYGASWGVSQTITNPNSAINQAVDPHAGTSVWTSPVFTCGPYPRKPC